jgi:hypothetical protein
MIKIKRFETRTEPEQAALGQDRNKYCMQFLTAVLFSSYGHKKD